MLEDEQFILFYFLEIVKLLITVYAICILC